MRRVIAGLVLAAMALSIAQASPAHAEVSARCTAHIAQHGGTPAADRRYHLEHGEFSPCTEQDAKDEPSKHDDHKDDDKSRYCRKHWYC